MADESAVTKAKSGEYGQDLSGANLEKADLSRADLSGVNFTGVSLSWTTISEAIYDETIKWPKDYNPETAGAVLT